MTERNERRVRLTGEQRGVQRRAMPFQTDAVDPEARTARLSFSSSTPYARDWGIEILEHGPGAVDLNRLNTGAPLLVDHDVTDLVGVVVEARIEDGRGVAVVRFGNSARAQEVFQDVRDGIRRNVSVSYLIHEMFLVPATEQTERVYRVARWEPLEISLVAVPADVSVGVGRAYEDREEQTMIENATPAPAQPPVIDIAAARADAVQAERERVQAIRMAGERMQVRAEAVADAIASGATVAQFVQRVHSEPALVQTVEAPTIGMSERECRQFSLARLLLAMGSPNDHQAQRDAGFELEATAAASQLAERRGRKRRPGSITVPEDIFSQPIAWTRSMATAAAGQFAKRDLTTGSAVSAGNLISTTLLGESFAEVLRARLVTSQLGATVLSGLGSTIAIPRQTVGAVVQWVTEGTAPTETDQQIVQVVMTPKTAAAQTDFTRKLLLQASDTIDVEAMVRADLTAALAVGIDEVALRGTGTGAQPRGIINTTGIGAVVIGPNGGPMTYAKMVELYTAVAAVNADFGSLGYAVTPQIRGRLLSTGILDSPTSGRPIWGDDNTVLGFPARSTSSLPSNLTRGTGTNLSAVVFGNFNDLFIGLWGGLDLVTNPYIQGGAGIIRVHALQEADVALRRLSSFAACLDAN